VPVTKAAYKLNKKEGYYDKYPGAKIPLQELSLHEPTKNSKGIRLGSYVQVRQILNEELEDVWSGKKTAQEALDAVVKRADKSLRHFQASHPQ
jgi:sn-glycerol 3-phosphate transport system substrate-binding protein